MSLKISEVYQRINWNAATMNIPYFRFRFLSKIERAKKEYVLHQTPILMLSNVFISDDLKMNVIMLLKCIFDKYRSIAKHET
jgi:hypothetical protein